MEINKILGILKLSSNTCYTKDGHSYKLFHPFCKSIQPFLVKTKRTLAKGFVQAYDKRTQLKDVITLVNIKDKCVIEYYDNSTIQDLPKLIGKANWTTYKKQVYPDIDLTPNRIDLTHLLSYTIDPENSQDRDDAISIEKNKDNYIIYIHISDPTSYIEQDTQLDKELFERCYSLYLDKTYHMMPEEFAINKISLTQDNISRAFTCKVIYDASYNLISYEFFKSNIKAINLTYEEADKLKETILKDLYEFAKNIKYNYQQDYDIHEMVARYMILCNYLVGLYLKDDLSISRYNNTLYNHITSDNISELDKLNNMCRYKRAEYSCTNHGHSILGLEYYQHFTSPLRRYADIIVHRILANKLSLITCNYTKDDIDKICNKLNSISSLYKLCYQIYNINLKITDFNDILSGTIIFIDNSNIKIYIDKLDLVLSFDLISRKISEQVGLIDNFELIDKSEVLHIQNNNTSFILKLYQEVKLKIYHNKLSNNIFTIELLEPNLKDFLTV